MAYANTNTMDFRMNAEPEPDRSTRTLIFILLFSISLLTEIAAIILLDILNYDDFETNTKIFVFVIEIILVGIQTKFLVSYCCGARHWLAFVVLYYLHGCAVGLVLILLLNGVLNEAYGPALYGASVPLMVISLILFLISQRYEPP